MTKLTWIIIAGFLTFSILNNFIYFDPLNGCFIKILPSWDFSFNQSKIKQGLVILKNALPNDYQNVCKKIDTIDPNVDCGNFEGGCYWPGNSKRISVSTVNTSLAWVAAVIVHETCHSRQNSENRPYDEAECYKENDRILKNLSIY